MPQSSPEDQSPSSAEPSPDVPTDMSLGLSLSDSDIVPPADLGFGSSSVWIDALQIDGPTPQVPGWLGKTVGRFRLVSLLGRGAFGRVFLADDVDLHRRVALKIITSQKAGRTLRSGARAGTSSAAGSDVLQSVEAETTARQAVERMIREARAAARIEHPGVVQIYEVGRLEGAGVGGYIAMELLDGGTLQDLVNASGPMDVARACSLIADAAEALQHGHDLGVIHRDVKPANLLLSRHGRCKIGDFGLAFVDDPSEGSRNARFAGTALYLAPEVIVGLTADEGSDQYSLAATLFTLVAGRPPYVGERKKVLEAHVQAPPPDLRLERPEIDPRLNDILWRAMSKNPGKRFEHIAQFGAALRPFTVPTPEIAVVSEGPAPEKPAATVAHPRPAQPPRRSQPAPPPRTQIIWPWVAASTTVLVMLLGAGLWLRTGSDAPSELSPTAGVVDDESEPQTAAGHVENGGIPSTRPEN